MTFNSLAERNKFIESHMKLVSSRVMKLNMSTFVEDLYQAGLIGLIEATDRFNEDKGYLFSTYAVRYIDGYILKYKSHDTLIKPLRKRTEKGCYQYKDVMSLDIPADGEHIPLKGRIEGYNTLEDDVIHKLVVRNFIKSLTEQECVIMNYRTENVSQEKISKILCMSQAQVSRIIKRMGEKYKCCQFT